jgi:hypothetical protein
MNTRKKILAFCFSLVGVSVLILVAILVLRENSLTDDKLNQNANTPEVGEGSPKIEKELGSPEDKGKVPLPKGRKLNSDLEKPSEDVVYPAVFPTIDELLSFGPRFLEESAVPEWKFDLQTLPPSLNSTILDEFKVQPTCMTLFKIAKEITSSDPKESLLKDFLLLIEALDVKVEPAGEPSPHALSHISYVRHLGNFIRFHLELLKFTDSLPVSDFIHGRLLKCPLKITNLEFISLLDTLSSPQSLDTLLDRFHDVALSSMFLKNNLREQKNSQFRFYSFVSKKALSLKTLIFLYQAKAPAALQSDYSLLIKSGFSHELVIKFVDAFYSQDPLPKDDSMFYLFDDFYSLSLSLKFAIADERDFSWYHITKPLPYHEYYRHLGFTQISRELPIFEKYMDSVGWSHPGNLVRRLFPDPNSQISPLEAFDSFFTEYRNSLFTKAQFLCAFNNYIEGFNYYKNDNEMNDIRVLGSLHREIALADFQINNYIIDLDRLHPGLKEDLEHRVFDITIPPVTPDVLITRLVSLWDMLDSIGQIETLSLCKDLFDSMCKFYALKLKHEQFRVNIMEKDASEKEICQKNWDNVWLPFQDLDWGTRISKIRNQQTGSMGGNS